MRRLYLLFLALGAACLLVPSAGRADDTSAVGVPPAQQQAFQLGYALGTPAAQAETFFQSVKGLKTITDDVQGVSEVGRLAERSVALRAGERRAYRQAAVLLRAMGAPTDLQTWAGGISYRLSLPLALSKEAKNFLASDPNTATVMGTIDEAQEIAADADGRQPGLIAWLKLRSGPAAVWAAGVGGLTARMHTAVSADKGLYLSRSEPRRLWSAAPDGTPGPVLDALRSLGPSTGNLAGLIRLPASLVPPRELREAQETLLDAYGAHSLAASIDKGP